MVYVNLSVLISLTQTMTEEEMNAIQIKMAIKFLMKETTVFLRTTLTKKI